MNTNIFSEWVIVV